MNIEVPAEGVRVIERARAGDGAAFAELVATYKTRIFGTIYRLTSRAQDVEDIGQDVFLRIHQSLPGLRDVQYFETWLYRLTVNAAYDYLRKRRRGCVTPMADLSDDQLRTADASESERRTAVATRQSEARELAAAILQAVSPEDRDLLRRKEIDGLSLKELAQVYRAKESALKVRLFRARRRRRQAHDKLFAAAA